MHSLIHEYITALRFDGAQVATLRLLGEYHGKQPVYSARSPEALKGLCQIAGVESTESSNRMEGVVVDPSRSKSLIGASPRRVQPVAAYHTPMTLADLTGRYATAEGLIESTAKGRWAKWKRVTAGASGKTAVLALGSRMDQ